MSTTPVSDAPSAPPSAPSARALDVVVCVKWVDLRPEIHPLTGAVSTDHRRYGFSEADRAAMEIGVRLAESSSGAVTLMCAAPPAADGALSELAASGATSVVRLDLDEGAAARDVAAAIVAALSVRGTGSPSRRLVVCGDYSVDRGTGVVPGLVAHGLGAQQALGLVEVGDLGAGGAPRLRVVRRLDGGRREHLEVGLPAVISVEGSVAKLRRAPLTAVLAARDLPIEIAPRVDSPLVEPALIGSSPIRPRPRVYPAPAAATALGRVVELTGALVERTPPRRVVAEPAEAAAAIVEQLRSWGYIE